MTPEDEEITENTIYSFLGWIIFAFVVDLVYLLWLGGKQAYEDIFGSRECRKWAEKYCYGVEPYRECVAEMRKLRERTNGSAWCREALIELQKK